MKKDLDFGKWLKEFNKYYEEWVRTLEKQAFDPNRQETGYICNALHGYLQRLENAKYDSKGVGSYTYKINYEDYRCAVKLRRVINGWLSREAVLRKVEDPAYKGTTYALSRYIESKESYFASAIPFFLKNKNNEIRLQLLDELYLKHV